MQHYYSKEQSSKLSLKPIYVSSRNIRLRLFTSSGVFSKKNIDKGTLALIENMIIKPGWQILDLGCGYGAVGLFASKLSHTIPYMIDINERACKLAKLNSKINNIKSHVLNGNIYEPLPKKKFNTILLNPPQTAGKQVCIDMITQSKNHLLKNGLLQLVARPNKGGKSLSKTMNEVFSNLQVIARKSGYSVYVSALHI